MSEEFKGLTPIDAPDESEGITSGDFPEGTMMRLTVKKYLWAVTGAIGIDVPVGTWDEVRNLVDDWGDFQFDLVQDLEEALNDIYDNAPSKSRSGSRRSSSSKGGGDGVLSAVRGKMFALATKKGVYVVAKYPEYKEWSVREIEDFMAELEDMPDTDEDAGKSATSRVKRARSSRRR